MKSKAKKPHMYQHLSADNDTNGNPRRLYVVMDRKANIVDVIDEEYKGFPQQLYGLIQLPEYPISIKLYKLLLAEFKAMNQ